jgi:hypothetical protein
MNEGTSGGQVTTLWPSKVDEIASSASANLIVSV